MDFSTDKFPKRTVWRPARLSSALMESIDNPTLIGNDNFMDNHDENNRFPTLPDITLTSQFTSLVLGSADRNDNVTKSFALIDGQENLKVRSVEEFILRLGIDIDNNSRVKVISIFGNTGDGKSHTLNHLFFGGREVFGVSSEQTSYTLGVWAAYDKVTGTICIDTEGLLGSTIEEARRTRLLLKVLAISDVVIYRTRSERIHRDMYTFLGSASRTYSHHFQSALDSINNKSNGGSRAPLGPAIIISHETRITRPLRTNSLETPEDLLRKNFKELNLDLDSFSSLKYVGQQTVELPTNYDELRKEVHAEIKNISVRSPRSPNIVYRALKGLNDKFNGKIIETVDIFPDEFFTCPTVCLSCNSRCQCSMGHSSKEEHKSNSRCKYSKHYENLLFTCAKCYKNGLEVFVQPQAYSSSDSSWYGLAKYAWSGYVIECPTCGEIYRSRQFWYGNSAPEMSAVRTEMHHVWPGMTCPGASSQNSAQRFIDGVSAITEVVSQASSSSTQAVGSWVADKVNPSYWKPNPQMCFICNTSFSSEVPKHHCRSCGEGVCSKCSSHSKPVPERGWSYPVRVCDNCFHPPPPDQSVIQTDGNEVLARKLSEVVVTTFTSFASMLEYPKSVIKETARPTYWTPDSEARECCVCTTHFVSVGGTAELHHCRSCGGAVCAKCSTKRKPVPHRGWQSAVRVCDNCEK